VVEESELAGDLVSLEFGSSKPVQIGSCREIGDSQRRRQAVNTEVEGRTALCKCLINQITNPQIRDQYLQNYTALRLRRQ
jgi:hypothetical protein